MRLVVADCALSSLAEAIIKTPEASRLGSIRQLGATSLIFLDTKMLNRLEHVIGVYKFSRFVVTQLQVRQPELRITDVDVECVSIAGLVHDLGHGPFSHLFEKVEKRLNVSFKHEKISGVILRHIYEKYPEIRKEWKIAGLDADDLVFIDEMVACDADDKFENQQWKLKGRSVDKSYLYDIVNNTFDSFDTDKFQYLLQDSRAAGLEIPFRMEHFYELVQNMHVVYDLGSGCRRICYDWTVREQLFAVGESRMVLHKILYQNPRVLHIEDRLVELLTDAIPILYPNAFNSPEDFCQLIDDRILEQIEESVGDDLSSAREILKEIEQGNFPLPIARMFLWPKDDRDQSSRNIFAQMAELNQYSSSKGFEVSFKIRELHRGLGLERHPMRFVRFVDAESGDFEPFAVDEEWMEKKHSDNGGILDVIIYCARDTNTERREAILEMLIEWAKETGRNVESLDDGE